MPPYAARCSPQQCAGRNPSFSDDFLNLTFSKVSILGHWNSYPCERSSGAIRAIKNMASILLFVIGGIVVAAVAGVGVHLWNHAQLRRDVLFDRQAMFHSSDAFHVVSAISLAPGQDLLDGVRHYVDGVGALGAEVVYAGKLAFPAPRKSRQMPDFDWQAFVIAQYPTREAWEAASSHENYASLKSEFARVWSLGMERRAGQNVGVAIAMLGLRVRHFLSGAQPTYPFDAIEATEDQHAEFKLRRQFLDQTTVENEAFSKDALVIINFQKKGNAEQRRADSKYGTRMMSMLAEVGYGPVHMGRPVSLEDNVDFDTVVVVAYPGIRYFMEMVQSRFYTSIFGGKQLNDDLSSPTVPILQHL